MQTQFSSNHVGGGGLRWGFKILTWEYIYTVIFEKFLIKNQWFDTLICKHFNVVQIHICLRLAWIRNLSFTWEYIENFKRDVLKSSRAKSYRSAKLIFCVYFTFYKLYKFFSCVTFCVTVVASMNCTTCCITPVSKVTSIQPQHFCFHLCFAATLIILCIQWVKFSMQHLTL